MGTEKTTVEIPNRDLVIMRAVFVTAFGAIILWAGNRLVATVTTEAITVSEKSASDRLADRRNMELALINQRIASIEAHIRTNCRGEAK